MFHVATLHLLYEHLSPLPSCELFLLDHETLTITIAYVLYMHIPSSSKLSLHYHFASEGMFLAVFALNFSIVVYQILLFTEVLSSLVTSQKYIIRIILISSRTRLGLRDFGAWWDM